MSTEDRAYCWGENRQGELGDGTRGTNRLTPVAVLGGLFFKQVSAGTYYTCGITTANRAYCWGYNNRGQVGDSSTGWVKLRPVRVRSTQQFSQIDAGYNHTCAVTTSDRAYCWGDNTRGRLGDGTTTRRLWPVPVASGLSFNRVAAGGGHGCAITPANRAHCWGYNGEGQLGDGTVTDRLKPAAVAGGRYFRQMDAGTNYTCGATPTSVAYCWGDNADGRLGDGTTTTRLTPTPVAGPM